MENYENGQSRRSFLNWLLVGGFGSLAAATIYPLVRFIYPPELPQAVQNSVVAAKTGEMPPNSGKIFKFGTKPGILIRTKGDEYRAFSAVCTHLQCAVQYEESRGDIWCACHNGRFDLSGKNISGPPPAPLEVFNVAIRGEEIIVSKKG
ncbi:MAG: plastoquinol--plastocyanin reductase [candidate division Zixibacteria bacterium CG_4_9_14_3_um_filter_46_8]|nr:MAG: plastoquinol--plastocyanin reductase [candidate division Zixibacteria bacterium CG_4_9_14_3_um_filter_46_8]